MMNRVFDNAADHIERYGTKGAILDVGCGFGFFLHHMKQKGWEVAGLELSLSGIHYAREELKISVVDTPFEQADLPKEYFDVITLFYVIEHTYDPLSFLKKIHTLLKPRGIIFLRYPHTTFVERLLTSLGIENNLYDIPFHLSDFTPLTIERFLIKAGFSNCEHFIGGYTLPQKFSHKMSSVIFGFLAEAVFQLSFKVCLLPGVSKSIIAQKNSH
jgi:SAM-dependent methyltransferase